MRSFFINVPRYLPFGIIVWVLTGIVLGNMDQSLELTDFGLTPFFVGCMIYVVIIFLYVFSADSVSSAIRLLIRKCPTVTAEVIWVVLLIFSGAAWGGAANFIFCIFENVTARTNAEINGKFTHYAKFTTRNKCNKIAVFSTRYGEIGACGMGYSSNFNLGIFIPENLIAGDEVVLVGRKNSMVFVLENIQFHKK